MAQLVEHDLAKVGVAGSNPVSRFFVALKFAVFMQVLGFFGFCEVESV